MIGKVKTKEVCPLCNKKFKDNGKDLICPEHQTRPHAYYAYFYYEGDHRVYGFKSYSDCTDYLIDVQRDIKKGRFDYRNYKAKTLKEFRVTTCLKQWIESRKQDMDCGIISPSYFRKIKEYENKIADFFDTADIRAIKKEHIKIFLRKLQSDGLSRKTKKNILAILHKFLKDINDEKELPVNVPKFPSISYELPQVNWIDEDLQEK